MNHQSENPNPIVIGITTDIDTDNTRYISACTYSKSIRDAGGIPIILPAVPEMVNEYLDICDGIVLTGGDDPNMEPFSIPTHKNARRINKVRQVFETELLKCVGAKPVLGICLGMQMMSLIAGGELNQQLADNWDTHGDHWGYKEHEVKSEILGSGTVHSHHRQGISNAGSLEIIATAHDGLIEGVRDQNRPFYVGIQWHPERCKHKLLGNGVFERLIQACVESTSGKNNYKS